MGLGREVGKGAGSSEEIAHIGPKGVEEGPSVGGFVIGVNRVSCVCRWKPSMSSVLSYIYLLNLYFVLFGHGQVRMSHWTMKFYQLCF